MAYNPNIHHRKSIRLKGYDYSQSGLYFITICSQDRECIFGEIINSEMKLNDIGEMAAREWMKLDARFPQLGVVSRLRRSGKRSPDRSDSWL